MLDNDICRPLYEEICQRLPEIREKKTTGRLKQDGTFVSDGDLLCQEIIFSYFANKLHDCIVISEESPLPKQGIDQYEYVVTVDPIDGTENFVSGLKEWGISASIYRNQRHLQSMIALPELGICLCTGDSIPLPYRSRICGISSYTKADSFKTLPIGFEYRIMGCCVYNIYNVISGSYSRFIHLSGAFSWDVLAGFNLALEHGVKIIIEELGEYHGQLLEAGKKYHFTMLRSS